MNLTSLIAGFKERTGRLDLSDPSITEYLNNACRLLDELDDSVNRPGRIYIEAAVDSYIYLLPESFREAYDVCLHKTSDGTISYLEWCAPSFLLRALRDETLGAPYGPVYTIVTAALLTDLDFTDIPIFKDSDFEPTNKDDRNRYLVIYPAIVEAGRIDIECAAYTPTLGGLVTTNYWATSKPYLIIQAAQYLLIKDLLNIDESTKIYSDLKASLKPKIFDSFEQERINKMEG